MTEQGTSNRVGVFGGSFDPIHNAHLEIAGAALRLHELDRVIFVPARHQPHKPQAPCAPAEHRLAMIRLAIQAHPAFCVSERELTRPGKSFTIDTIRELQERLPAGTALLFIVGSDSVPEFPRWRSLEELAERCLFVVAARPGWPLEALDALSSRLSPERVAAVKDAAIRTPAAPVSSTDIRARVAAGASIRGLVPDAVADYIARNKLYSGRQGKYDNMV